MTTDVQIAESSPATPESPAAPQSIYMERVKALKGADRAHYDLTGELPIIEPPAKPADPPPADVVPAESSPEATKGPDLASGDDDPEQLTPAQRKANNRNLRNELIRANAEKELLKAQLAESRKPAPAAEVVKPVEPPAMPTDAPRLKDFKGEDAVDLWETALLKWTKAQHDSSISQAVNKALEQFELKQREANWGTKLKAARSEYKDFDAVALSPQTPVSVTGIRVMQAREDFGRIAYYLGKHPQEAERITTFENDDKLNADPIQRAKAEARLEAEFDSIARMLEAAPKKKPADEQINDLPRPSSEVEIPHKASANAGDAIAQALKNKDFKTYSRLKNEEEAQALKAKR
jgi:plasmid stabilization system protein ParE